jgi:thioredoxin 1
MKSFTAWGVGLILLGSVVGCQGQPAATRDDRAGAQATSAIQRLPRLVDVGAGKCIPCKAMAPILEDLRTRYAGKLEVLFVDVWKDPDAGRPYSVVAIPTQIFYGPDGQELARHQGFMSKEEILAQLKAVGVEL